MRSQSLVASLLFSVIAVVLMGFTASHFLGEDANGASVSPYKVEFIEESKRAKLEEKVNNFLSTMTLGCQVEVDYERPSYHGHTAMIVYHCESF